jgi:hypothetical protein
MPELREVFEMTTKQLEPDLDAWEEQEGRQRKSARNRKIGALVVVLFFCVVAMALLIGMLEERNESRPGNQPTVRPGTPTAEEVATGFVAAFGNADLVRAFEYLAPGADLSRIDQGTAKFPLLLEILNAQNYEHQNISCQDSRTSDVGTEVHCSFYFHSIRSQEIGRGPYPGSMDITVRDGKIIQASLDWDISQFSGEMWEPFTDWMRKTHPADAVIMYDAGYRNWKLTTKSIPLWEEHTKEYVRIVNRTPDATASP